MEPTYTVLAADGSQYGPATKEQLHSWITEGRIISTTQVWRSDTSAWAAASSLPELGIPASAVATPTASVGAPAMSSYDPELVRRMRSGAGWFYWIAAFTMINSIMTNTGSGWGFALGLGFPQLVDAAAAQSGGTGRAVGIVINALAAGLLALFGIFAGKGHAWAFLVGMVVLALDTALVGFRQMWISVAIHVWALISIFSGFRASRQLR
jgi:hypothetical protein